MVSVRKRRKSKFRSVPKNKALGMLLGLHVGDSLGAVTGALAGAFYGIEKIPKRWLSAIKRRQEIEDLVDKIYND